MSFLKHLRCCNQVCKLTTQATIYVAGLWGLSSCAALYHVQVSDIKDARRARVIDVKLSETAFDIKGAMKTINRYYRSKAINKDAQQLHDNVDAALALINYGPKTGTPVFTDKYSDYLLDAIIEKCQSGKITGLTSVREARNYPYISGEIINVRGFCID